MPWNRRQGHDRDCRIHRGESGSEEPPLRAWFASVGNNMKKTFKLTHPKIKFNRLVEAVRCEVRKYLKRERNKKLPEGVDFWDFDCKFGPTAEAANGIHVAELGKCIDAAEAQQLESFYVEILAKPGHRTKKPVATLKEDGLEPAP